MSAKVTARDVEDHTFKLSSKYFISSPPARRTMSASSPKRHVAELSRRQHNNVGYFGSKSFGSNLVSGRFHIGTPLSQEAEPLLDD